jgi:hypothetical protein
MARQTMGKPKSGMMMPPMISAITTARIGTIINCSKSKRDTTARRRTSSVMVS